MLNELKTMLDGIEELVDISPTHKDITQAGGKEAIRVLLEVDENDVVFIKGLEYLNKSHLNNVWVLKGYKDLFPTIKLTKPLRPKGNKLFNLCLDYRSSKQADEKDKKLNEINQLCESIGSSNLEGSQITHTPSLIKYLLDQFHSEQPFRKVWPSYRKNILEKSYQFEGSKNEAIQIVLELYRRYLKFGENGLEFVQKLDQEIERSLKGDSLSEANQTQLLNTLFGSKPVKTNGELPDVEGVRIKLVLDYLPDKNIDIFATDLNKRKKTISNYLINSEREKINEGEKFYCPILGDSSSLVSSTFPKINLGEGLPVSIISPYSKFDDKGKKTTVRRYDRAEINSYTIDLDLSQKIDGLLRELTSKNNKDKTWKSIPSEKSKQRDLLIAYCHGDLNLPATQFVTQVEDLDDYQNRTQDLISLLNKGDLSPDALVDFIVIRKVDKANQKVVYSNACSLGQLEKAAHSWQIACANTPEFTLAIIGKDKKRHYVKPYALAPDQLTALSKQVFDLDGDVSKGEVPAISFSESMRIFFNQDDFSQRIAEHSLKKITAQTQKLFAFCAEARNLGSKEKVPIDANINALKMTTLMAVLLFKMNRRKEDYMSELSFKLGQYCSAMNELHIGYCRVVRKGSMPTTLIGSAAYAIALHSPIKALEYIALRLKPYESWARGMQAEGKQDNSLYAFHWMQRNAKELKDALLQPKSISSKTHQAELMLGYLAGRPFEKSDNPSNSTEEGNK